MKKGTSSRILVPPSRSFPRSPSKPAICSSRSLDLLCCLWTSAGAEERVSCLVWLQLGTFLVTSASRDRATSPT
eukprot:496275-Rhodomonas_salina.2